jgi:hypothetical protein
MLAAGCGSTTGTETANTGNSVETESRPTEISSANPDGGVPEPVDASPTDANAGSQEPLTVAEAANRKRERLGAEADTSQVKLPAAKPMRRPAPDDSEYWSTLTDVAREVREFKSDPQISRVERTNDGTTSVLTIHLKNGKVVKHPGDRVRNMSTESISTFVRLAGLPARPLPTPERSETAENPNKKKSDRGRP